MIELLHAILSSLLRHADDPGEFSLLDPTGQFDAQATDAMDVCRSANAAFLISLCGPDHPEAGAAAAQLDRLADSDEWGEVGQFYRQAVQLVRDEIATRCHRDAAFADRMTALAEWVASDQNLQDAAATRERLWSVIFPEATGICGHERARIDELRARRRVSIRQLNDEPISDPARQILFTSNVLLTLPSESTPIESLGFSDELESQLRDACDQPQRYWYDHPIQIGVDPAANEVLYGLAGLQSALKYERERGHVAADARMTCVLSVSVTHSGLRGLARQYMLEEFERFGGFEGLDVFMFTERDTQRIIDDVLVPAAERYLNRDDARDVLNMFGVDGHYGRHYSFLKAVAAFWSVTIDPQVRATFKIDLDQVFPQEELAAQSGRSALEHFMTPLWGAQGVDADGAPVELGMIAGALVNEKDIAAGLFTPDVRFPDREPAPDECVFFNALPQALSTQAEMMTRYDTAELDGQTSCIHRIHVTGGTNGILVDALRRHRPFTPSFIGRAEDQACVLSAFGGPGDRLAYIHEPGLIMRHDKEAFAQQAMAAAHVGQQVADYERILLFSAYAQLLGEGADAIKRVIDPFTGCFVSRLPMTVVHLRFALKAASMFAAGDAETAGQFVRQGARRIPKTLDFVDGQDSQLKQQYKAERTGWDLFYQTLDVIEAAVANGDGFAHDLRRRAREIVGQCTISGGQPAGETFR